MSLNCAYIIIIIIYYHYCFCFNTLNVVGLISIAGEVFNVLSCGRTISGIELLRKRFVI